MLLITKLTASIVASATLTPQLQRGEQLITHPVAGRAPEVCVIPLHLAGADYSKDDLEEEQELCSLNIQDNANTAVCPKISSTNPGLELFSIPQGMTKKQVEDKKCVVLGPIDPETGKPEKLAKKKAKYKLSTSCSYAPSILGYYHVSRLLGDIAGVEPAVLRTVDLKTHVELGTVGLRAAAATRGGTQSLIYQTWSGLLKILKNPQGSARKDFVMTDDLDQSYGALLRTAKGEKGYKELFNSGADRVAAFRDNNPLFQLLTNNQPIERIVPRQFTQANVQKLMQMRDISEFILLDVIMNQQDRFGNIDAVEKFAYLEQNKSGQMVLKTKRKLKPADAQALNAVKVKEIILTDNDCGVAKEARVKAGGLHKKIAHLSPDLYERIIKFDRVADNADLKEFFRKNLMFTESDFASVRKNLRELATMLQDNCNSGKLLLDLDVKTHFTTATAPAASCQVP